MEDNKKLRCDTCGNDAEHLYRDVLDKDYNALMRPVVWNCKACYDRKRSERLGKQEP